MFSRPHGQLANSKHIERQQKGGGPSSKGKNPDQRAKACPFKQKDARPAYRNRNHGNNPRVSRADKSTLHVGNLHFDFTDRSFPVAIDKRLAALRANAGLISAHVVAAAQADWSKLGLFRFGLKLIENRITVSKRHGSITRPCKRLHAFTCPRDWPRWNHLRVR
jgi:hypothetical protein